MNEVLFSRSFALMLLGQVVSILGNAMLRFALSLYVLDLTGSATLFGAVLAASMLPTVLLSPVGGVLADRLPRQRIMYVLDFLTAAAVWNFGTFGLGGSALPPAALLLFLSAIQALYQPSVLSSVPLLAPQRALARANALVTQVSALSTLLGPVAGGMFYGFWGMRPLCLISAGCLLAAAVMECFLRIPFTPAPGHGLGTAWRDLGEAGRFLAASGLLPLLGVVAGINLCLSPLYLVGLPYFVKITLGLSSQLYSLVEAAMGLGTILGALLVGALGSRLVFSRSWRYLLAGALPLAAMAPAIAFRGLPLISWGVLLTAALLGMTAAGVFSILAQTYFQTMTPPALLGKVGSFVTAAAACALPLGQGLYGAALDHLPAWLVPLLGLAACLPLIGTARRKLGDI
ncbi:MFS transporter [Vermiculatibacterium agrestimuris]|uniref:MFS transporter n=1 Tax=Vermiculatibacterium agrestimuris TaxID=2941519 RepID=UPI00203BFF34|nr:MFS transporter [Vermiculatibacterium agrestimuris]